MPSAFRNPKNLAEWLRLDYFRFPRTLPRLRATLVWLTLLACVFGIGAAFFTRSAPRLYQAGPLSSKHASFNNDCGVCHRDHFATVKRFLPWNHSVSSVPDDACRACHQEVHDHTEKAKSASCASCHQEHRGHASLARVPDNRCLSCHSNLKANSTDGDKCPFENVSGFPAGHPEFRVPSEDPGKVHFNHASHISLTNVDGKPMLDCASCHQPDDTGRYMRPINYQSHCKQCHPLSVQLGGTFEDMALADAAAAFAKEPAPHTDPAVVRAVLRERLFRFVDEHPLKSGEAIEERGVPKPPALEGDVTKRRWAASATMNDTDKLAFVQGQLALSEQLCFDRPGGCALCHDETKPRGKAALPKYAGEIPTRWFAHAQFDHQAHRMTRCVECHADAEKSVRSSDVMLPGLQSCARCHSAGGGARSDCLECHTYHPRNRPTGESPGK
jgi:hypothetical protein